MLPHPWHGEALEHSAGWLGSLLPPQTSLRPAHHPQENSPYADFQGLQPQLTSPNLELFHTLQVSSQALGASRPFQGSFYPRVRTPALLSVFPHAAPPPWPQKALAGKVKSTQQAASLPRLPRLLGILGKEGREGERRISGEQGGPVRSCDRLGLLVPPRWQCQHAVLKYLAGLRSKHPI